MVIILSLIGVDPGFNEDIDFTCFLASTVSIKASLLLFSQPFRVLYYLSFLYSVGVYTFLWLIISYHIVSLLH